jgi:hypothetical protein
MAGKRLDVHYCVLNALTRRYGPTQTSDLLGVNYIVAVPPDTEFPRLLPTMDLFVRFFVSGVPSAAFAIRVYWLGPDGRPVRLLNKFRSSLHFDPAARIEDHAFRLQGIEVAGSGIHAVRLYRRAKHRWKGFRWRLLATDYFEVTR